LTIFDLQEHSTPFSGDVKRFSGNFSGRIRRCISIGGKLVSAGTGMI